MDSYKLVPVFVSDNLVVLDIEFNERDHLNVLAQELVMLFVVN